MRASRKQTIVSVIVSVILAVGLIGGGLIGCGPKGKKESGKEQLLTPEQQKEMMKKMQKGG